MKAAIRADGTLVITPETDLEAFAVSCWIEKNATTDWYNAAPPAVPKVIANLSAFAELRPNFLKVPS